MKKPKEGKPLDITGVDLICDVILYLYLLSFGLFNNTIFRIFKGFI